jgi:hypothetical protein
MRTGSRLQQQPHHADPDDDHERRDDTEESLSTYGLAVLQSRYWSAPDAFETRHGDHKCPADRNGDPSQIQYQAGADHSLSQRVYAAEALDAGAQEWCGCGAGPPTAWCVRQENAGAAELLPWPGRSTSLRAGGRARLAAFRPSRAERRSLRTLPLAAG